MSDASPGHVYLRSDLLYFGRDRIHLASNAEHELTRADAALVELVYRGYGDFDALQAVLAGLVRDASAAATRDRLAQVLRDERSVLELRAGPPVERPEVIVCDFTGAEAPLTARDLVRALRRNRKVVVLGLDERVRGNPRENVAFAATKKTGHHASWFEYLQWCRGFVGAHPNAVLVLCGQQDAILFGDFARRMPCLVVASPTWPPATTPVDLRGEALPTDHDFDAIRSLLYAMQFTAQQDWAVVQRANSSDLALLEVAALRDAAVVLYSEVDQFEALVHLGRARESTRFCHRVGMLPRRQGAPRGEPVLVLISGMEDEGRPVFRYLQILHAMDPAARRGVRLAVATPSGWLRHEAADGRLMLVAEAGEPPLSDCIGAIAMVGLLRNPAIAFEIMARGIPTVCVPSERRHPLLEHLPAEMVLPESSPTTLARRIADWLGDGEHRSAAQDDFVQRLGLVSRVREFVADACGGTRHA